MRARPAGTDAVPAPLVCAAVRFLGLDEVTWPAYDRVGLEHVGDVEQQSLVDIGNVILVPDESRVRWRAGGDHGQHFLRIELRRV